MHVNYKLRPQTVRDPHRHGPAATLALIEVDEGAVVFAAHRRSRGEVLEMANIGELPESMPDSRPVSKLYSALGRCPGSARNCR